jgi:PAS domain S-box-containing protein
MLNFSSDHIVVVDADRKIIQISESLLTLLNMERENILGHGIDVIPHPLFTSQAMRSKAMEAFHGKEVTFENKVQIDEKKIDFNIKIVPTTFDEGSIGVTWIIQDITERKRAEEALLQKTRQQEILLSSIPAFVYYKDTDARFITANKAFSDLVKTPLDQILGKTSYDFFPQEEAEQIQKVDREVIASGEPRINFEVPYTNRAGEKRWAASL